MEGISSETEAAFAPLQPIPPTVDLCRSFPHADVQCRAGMQALLGWGPWASSARQQPRGHLLEEVPEGEVQGAGVSVLGAGEGEAVWD